jgi:hypothetical protein
LIVFVLTSFTQLAIAQVSRHLTDLKPGARIILKFPELPQSLYAMQSGNEATTQLYIALPENYSADRKYPLFVFLYGGHGGPGAGPGRGLEIMENKDCIFVNLPLFKNQIEPDGPFKGLLISPELDGDVICRAYAAMFKKIYEVIPNIDTRHNIIGGMSNGAHSIVTMFEKGDAYLMGLFQNVILVEGGFNYVKTFSRYQGKGMLYLYGDYAGQDDWTGRKMREDLPKFMKKFAESAAANKLDATGFVMPNTGHDMPARFNNDVRKWILSQLEK